MWFAPCPRLVRCLPDAVVTACVLSSSVMACGGEGTASRTSSGGGIQASAGAAVAPAAPPAGALDPAASATGGAGSEVPTSGAVGPGGAPGAAGSGTLKPNDVEPAATTGDFRLAWEDNFDAFDSSRWILMTHSWDTNLAQFSTSNVRFDSGTLSLLLTPEPSDVAKPFRGVEMRSVDTLTYGKVEARVRLARGSGVVSSLVLIYTPWPADDWNELDVEYLGRYNDRVQFNTMVYTGAPTQPPVQESVSPTQYPFLATLAFDPSADFHVYGIEWTPTEARFSVDGETQHVWSTEIARMKLPQNILLTIWASSAADWAGPIESNTVPTSADYDWIRVYTYDAAP